LLDASNPAGAAADLPGARPITGRDDLVRLDAVTVARRDGHTWLVARGENLDIAIDVLTTAFARP